MMKQGDPKKELWGVIQSNPDTKDLFVDEADFDSLLTADPKGVYSAIESTGMFVDYSDFEGVMGLKKKEPSEPVSPVGSGASQPTSKVDRAAEIRKLTAKAVAGDEVARVGLERLLKEKETGVSVGQQAREADAARKQQQYEANKPKIDQYREIATQTGIADVNLGELETAFKQAKGANDYGAAAQIEAELNKTYEGIDRAYIESLRSESPQLAGDKESTYNAISSKLKEGGTASLSQYEQRFLRDLRNSALASYYSSINAEMYELRQQADIPTYNKKSALLSERARKLQGEADALQNQPMTVQSKRRLEEIGAEFVRIQGEGERLAQETGVTPEVLERASRISSQVQALDSEIARNSTRYGELAMEDIDERVSKAKRKGEGNWDAFKNSFMESVSSMVMGIPKVLKTDVAHEAEVVEYDWVDKLYLWADDLQKVAEQRRGQPYSAAEYEAMPLSERLPYMIGGGAGSVAVFATGGVAGVGTKLGGTAATMGIAYLTGEPAAYDEAINAGLDVGEAQTFSKFFGAITAGIEGVMPDFKLLAPSIRMGAIQLIKQGMPYKQAIKKSLAEYSKEIADAALKEGVFEEGFSGVFSDITKETANLIKDEAVFEDTFFRQGPQEIGEQVLIGAILGGGVKAVSGIATKRSDASEDIVMQVAEQGADLVADVSSIDPEQGAELADLQERTTEILNGLKAQPGFAKLPREKQAHVLSELDRKERLEESMRAAGVKPESTLAEIAAIEAEVKFILDTGMTASEASLARNKAGAEPEPAPVEVELEPTVAEAPKEESSATLTKEPVVEVSPAQSLITDETAQATDNAAIGEVRLPDIGVAGKREGDAVQPAVDVGADTGDADALRDVESTAKALEGADATKLGYVKYEDAIIVEPQVDFDNLPKGNDELSREARSQAIRDQENKPPKYKKYPIGTRAVDRFGEVYELREVPLDEAISKKEGTQREATIDKYAEWIKQGNEMPPAKGVENFATERGKVKITDGNHRYQAAKKAGLKTIPVWVALTDKKNTARPIYAKNEISEAYHAAKKDGSNPELVKAVEDLLGKPTQAARSEVVSKESEKIDMNQPRVEDVNISPQLADFDAITTLKGPEATAARREYKAKHGEQTYKKVQDITRNFEKIVQRLETEGKIKKKCP